MKLARDSWIVFCRQTHLLLQSPAWVIAGSLQPFFFVVLFAPLLPRILGVASTGEAYAVFIPGLLVLSTMYSALFAGIGLIGESRSGVIDRFRVTPVNRLALLLGRCGREVVVVLIQGVAIIVVATVLGMRVGVLEMLLAFTLLALVTMMLSALSYWFATVVRSEQSMSSVVGSATQPLMLLSGVMLPLSLAPAWMTTVAWWNPLSHVVDAQRALFAGNIGDPVVWQTTLVVLGLTALVAAMARKAFQRVVA